MKQQIDLVEDLSPRIAATAVRNAISFEVKKDALQQRQNGDWMIRFVAQAIDLKPVDIDQVIVNAKMGTRYLCTLVELDADETPVDHQAKRRDEWRALGPVKQAGIRCTDPIFGRTSQRSTATRWSSGSRMRPPSCARSAAC